MTKKIAICGGAGFLGTHLSKRLVDDGHYVAVFDKKYPEFDLKPAHQYNVFDLTNEPSYYAIFKWNNFDEVYQLAAEVGGLGYIMDHNNDYEMLTNSMRINLNVLEACRQAGVPKVFFASSACVYHDIPADKDPRFVYRHEDEGVIPPPGLRETDAWPYAGDNFYAHEKMFAEFLYDAWARKHDRQVRIARYFNYYGPFGTWRGGREKAPAAICRKVAEAENNGAITIWGDGRQTRSFMYVDDAVEGAVRLMASDYSGPVNIGSAESVSINGVIDTVTAIAGKNVLIGSTPGPVGVNSRHADQTLCKRVLGWAPSISLVEGLAKTYPWIEEQVRLTKSKT